MKEMMSITEVAKMLRISPSTIKKWEEMGKVKRAKRDRRGWRVYDQNDAVKLMALHIVHQI
ncbi:MAG: MerR family DNA-binding transcriptional regulator [Candidatus Scalindua sp.]